MDIMDNTQDNSFLEIDYSKLMDLRVDYAFKLLFGTGDTLFLVSLLNAIFANKKIPRKIIELTIVNPYLEKYSKGDKLSIIDIRAQLDDGTTILIEMHLYDISDLKYKTIRSWARVYGEELKVSEGYLSQPPVVCVSFVDGSIDDGETQKIHKCCKIMDIDDCTVFSDAMELHYIDMKAFVKVINEKGDIVKRETEKSMLEKWLTVITEKDIEDKTIIKKICEEQEEIGMAVSALVRLSEDKVTRQAYRRRQDEVLLQNKKDIEYALMKQRAEQSDQRAEQANQRAEQSDQRAEQAEIEIEKLRKKLKELEAQANKP